MAIKELQRFLSNAIFRASPSDKRKISSAFVLRVPASCCWRIARFQKRTCSAKSAKATRLRSKPSMKAASESEHKWWALRKAAGSAARLIQKSDKRLERLSRIFRRFSSSLLKRRHRLKQPV